MIKAHFDVHILIMLDVMELQLLNMILTTFEIFNQALQMLIMSELFHDTMTIR